MTALIILGILFIAEVVLFLVDYYPEVKTRKDVEAAKIEMKKKDFKNARRHLETARERKTQTSGLAGEMLKELDRRGL